MKVEELEGGRVGHERLEQIYVVKNWWKYVKIR